MSRAARSSPLARPSRPPLLGKAISGYCNYSTLPLASLVFVIPLIVLYELGTRRYATDPAHHAEQRIIAFNMMRTMFQLFGATGKYLPALAVIGGLVGCHFARKDKFVIRPGALLVMVFESALLCLPLILLADIVSRHMLQASQGGSWKPLVVLSIGAGVYEELVFRLLGFALLSLILIDCIGFSKNVGGVLIVLISAVLFSLYHYWGNEPFDWRTFAFRTVAGAYFGVIFLSRGFGITVGAHASYDIFLVIVQFAA